MNFRKFLSDDSNMMVVDITALVDIAFIIILFLGIVASISPVSTINVELPQSSSQETVAKPLKVVIDKDGNFYVKGKKVDKKEVAAYLSKQNSKSLVIIADKRVPYGKVVEIMDIAKQVGIEEINIATKRGG